VVRAAARDGKTLTERAGTPDAYRRRFVTAAAAAVATGAGCGGPFASQEPASLGDPPVGRPGDGRAYHNFASDGDPVASVDVAVRPPG
jgi:hypothetical protein